MEDDFELERREIWRALVEACDGLREPKVRMALGLAVLGELLDDGRVDAGAILDAIERAQSAVYLRQHPPTGGAS